MSPSSSTTLRSQHGQDTQGSAYDRPVPSADHDISSVDRRTPGGELLRRYWHPVALVSEVGDLPLQVRVLGEDLILFKTPAGQFGLVHDRCAHRGTSLFYGKVEERGIRCCYHGWLFDTEGRCVEQPCEPGGGEHREKVRQPWYPVEELYGLVFAYMGPPALKPVLPRYDALEDVADDEILHANGNSIGSGGPYRMPCNWLQTHENVMDPWHVFVLHSSFSGDQFNKLMGARPDISFEYTPTGMISTQIRPAPNGEIFRRVTEIAMPNVRIVANPFLQVIGRSDNVSWTLPIDETNTRIFTVRKTKKDAPWLEPGHQKLYEGKSWFELSDEEHQRFPGDYEAQVSQGQVSLHSEENLASSDRGVGMYRRLLRQSLKQVQSDQDPMNIIRDDGAGVHAVRAGNFFEAKT